MQCLLTSSYDPVNYFQNKFALKWIFLKSLFHSRLSKENSELSHLLRNMSFHTPVNSDGSSIIFQELDNRLIATNIGHK